MRDESLHCEGIIRLFHTFVKERDCLTKAVKDDIADQCQTTVRLEDAFIDLAFEQGPVNGMTPKDIKKYIRYIADWRMGQLGMKPIYMIDEHPLPWLSPAAQRRGARQLLRTARDRIFEGRDARAVERRVGFVRQAAEGEGRAGGERGCRGWRERGYVWRGGDGGGVKVSLTPHFCWLISCPISNNSLSASYM